MKHMRHFYIFHALMECDRKFQVVAFCVWILGPICEFLTTELS